MSETRIDVVRRCAAEERPLQVGAEWVRELAAEIDALIRPAPLAASEPVACPRCVQLDEGMAALASTLDQHDSITLSDYLVQSGELEWDQRIVMSFGDEVYHDVGSFEELLFREALSRRNGKAIAKIVSSELSNDEKQEQIKRILESEQQPFTPRPSAAAVTVTEAMAMAALRSWAHHINANNSTGIEAMTHAITAALTAAPAVPVVELDEWRVVDKDNRTYLSPFSSSDTAEQWRRNANVLHHEAAPHRVMRVCLVPVEVDV